MTKNQFKRWLQARLSEVEPMISRQPTEHCAQIVFEAKAHAYRLRHYDLARQLPERDVITPLDCCLRLRDCLTYLERPLSTDRDSGALIGLADAAKILGYRADGLRRLVKQKRIKYVQHGQGRIKFRREWLDEYISANSSGPQDIKRSPAQRRKVRMDFEPRHGFDPSLFLK
jgi:excisionase family DNA binding protein